MTRFFLAALVLWSGLVPTAARLAAQDGLRISRPEVRREVVGVIAAQLAALREGEVARAYRLAALELREQMSLRAFAAVVRENYPEIWGNRGAEFGIVRDDGRHAVVTVHVSGDAGQSGFEYVLVEEGGGWRIGSVLRRPPRPRPSV